MKSEAEREAESYVNRAQRGAFWKGYQAGRKGLTTAHCPYADHRTTRGSVTFSRAFRTAWFAGRKIGLRDAHWHLFYAPIGQPRGLGGL